MRPSGVPLRERRKGQAAGRAGRVGSSGPGFDLLLHPASITYNGSMDSPVPLYPTDCPPSYEAVMGLRGDSQVRTGLGAGQEAGVEPAKPTEE